MKHIDERILALRHKNTSPKGINMSVIMGAVGKSPSIDKYNRLMQDNFKQSSGEYLEKQILLTQEKIMNVIPRQRLTGRS